MNRSEANIALLNTIGRFAQFYSSKQFAKIPALFADSPNTTFSMLEEEICLSGYERIKAFFEGSVKKENELEILLTHTHAIKWGADGMTAEVTWMGHDITAQLSEKTTTEYGVRRFDAQMKEEGGNWVFTALTMYYFMSFIPETYDMKPMVPPHSDEITDLCTPDRTGVTTAADYVEIRRLQNYWSHSKRAIGMDAFADNDSIALHYPLFFSETKHGREEVSEALAYLDQLEKDNDYKFIDIPMTTAAVIEAGPDGQTAHGTWLVLSNSITGPAFGHPEFYCPNICRIGRMKQTYVRENGGWKIQSFDLEYFFAMPQNTFDREASRMTGIMKKDPAEKWQNPPPLSDATLAHFEDVLEIEQLVTHWTYGIRYRSFARFYYDFYARESDLADPNFAPGGMMFGMTDSFYEEQPKFCGWHCGTTPIVEIDPSGETATAAWLDYGFTSFGEKFGFDEMPLYANAGIARYCFQCVKCNGKWKMYNFTWKPYYRIRYLKNFWRFDYMQTKGWQGADTPERFPLPFHPYTYVKERRDWTKPFALVPPEISSPLEQQKGLVIGE